MGVIYKLKEDVIAFIIDQKKSNPSLGVRQLASVTSEKFQIKVSKSSVGTTLKNASLSSAVGRKAINAARGEKFAIPPSRKSEISKSMQKAGFTKDKGEAKGVKKRKGLSLMPNSPKQEQSTPPASRDKEKISVNNVSQDNNFLVHVEHLRTQKKNKKISSLRGMGFVFLKAAQWETSSKSLMSELFKSHVSASSHNSFDIACEIFLLLKFLGVETFEHASAYKDHGLWQLNELQNQTSDESEVLLRLQELFQWSYNATDTSTLSIVLEYDLERKHIFSEVNGFELCLEDGTKLMLDAPLSSFGFGARAPICKSMTWLSNYVISNIRSPIFFTVPGEKIFDQAFYNMVAIFENLPGKKIQKVIVRNQDNQEIAEFSTIPAQRRTFLIGVMPRQKEFVQLTKNGKWSEKKPFYHQELNRVLYYGETKTDYLASHFQENVNNFRVIALWQNKEENPFWAIVTNQNNGSSEDIVRAYISRWPYFSEEGEAVSENSQHCNEEKEDINTTQKYGNLEFRDIFSDYVQMLNQYCYKHFFPKNYSEIDINKMMQTVYESSGSFERSENGITVSLEIPVNAPHRKDMEYALRRVNERHIFDHFGRKLWVEI